MTKLNDLLVGQVNLERDIVNVMAWGPYKNDTDSLVNAIRESLVKAQEFAASPEQLELNRNRLCERLTNSMRLVHVPGEKTGERERVVKSVYQDVYLPMENDVLEIEKDLLKAQYTGKGGGRGFVHGNDNTE